MRAAHDAPEIRRHHAFEFGERHFLEPSLQRDARIVDQYIEARMLADRRFREAFTIVLLRDTGAMRADIHLMALSKLLRDRAQLRLVDIGEREIRALRRKLEGERPPDSARRARQSDSPALDGRHDSMSRPFSTDR